MSSASLGAFFDSTHFYDGSPIKIQMKVWDTSNNYYTGAVSANAYNKGYVSALADWRFPLTNGILSNVEGSLALSNHGTLRSTADDNTATLNRIPTYTAFYIGCHAGTGAFHSSLDPEGSVAGIRFTTPVPSVQSQVSTKDSVQTPPYNFVFIDGCQSAGSILNGSFTAGSGATGFGITGTDRAFLGWGNLTSGQTNGDYIETVWQSLSEGNTLYDAVLAGIERCPPTGPTGPVWQIWNEQRISPVIVGDSAMKLHGLYASPVSTNTWFRSMVRP